MICQAESLLLGCQQIDGEMALECPECGAPGAVEYKHDRYVCKHCDNLFEPVRPSRLTVDVRPTFCACGNIAEFQCQVCNSVLLCQECDLVERSGREWPKWESYYSGSRIALPVVGFGYMIKIERHRILAIQGNRLVWLGDGSAPGGLVLFLDDIFPQVEVSAGGEVRHLCCSCFAAAVPAAAQAIANGYICEQPSCGRPGQNRCRCCQASFCDLHLSSETRRVSSQPLGQIERISWGRNPDGTLLHWNAFVGDVAYTFPFLSGICDMCTFERGSVMRSTVKSITVAHLGGDSNLIQESPVVGITWLVPTRKMPLAFLQEVENRRARKIAEECAEAVRAKLTALEKLPGACRRDEWFADVRISGQSAAGGLYYRVVDDRKRRAPAAAPEPGRR